MVKRVIDICVSLFGLTIASPLLLVVMFLVWLEDKRSPFYIAPRVGLRGKIFRMVKMRSMVINADRQGASSTSNADRRITPVGRFIRSYKIDELTQLWNVLRGDMSLVGPRPQVQAGVDVYTSQERELLTVRPGITDLASIVFSDEGAILHGSVDPDADYDALIRPWKSRLGLIYVHKHTIRLDLELILATALAIVSRPRALRMVEGLLRRVGASAEVVRVSSRQAALSPALPPNGEFDP